MEFDIESFKIYLPSYLSEDSVRALFKSISDFIEKAESNGYYTSHLKDEKIIFQGDCLKAMPIINLPNKTIKDLPVIVLSNTCDMDLGNDRVFGSQIVYAPIMQLSKYINLYRTNLVNKGLKTEEQLQSLLVSIRKQEKTDLFYLPKINNILEESIALLDRTCNCENKYISRDDLKNNRTFTLSNFGAYLLLLKLSIHFTRFQDKVDRK